MRCFYSFILNGFSNTYLVGPDEGGDAIIVDPGEMSIKLFKLIEGYNYYIRHILVTHVDSPHTKGIKTLLKIYDAKVYAKSEEIHGIKTVKVEPGKSLELSGFNVRIINAPIPAEDSILYKIDNILFTGDIIGAGRLNKSFKTFDRANLRFYIENQLLSMEDNTLIFPGHGPPSTLKAERMFNPDIKDILESSRN